MKVLHINCNYLTTVLHQTMIEHLDEQGVESTVFAPTWSLEKAAIKPNTNVVAKECFHYKDRYVFFYKQGKIRRTLEQSVDVSAYDCIHAYTLFTDGNAARALSHKYRIPYVVAVRSTDVDVFFKYRPYLRGLGIQILRDASAVFFLSTEYGKQFMERYVPARYQQEIRTKLHIVGNGIDDFWLNNKYRRVGEQDGIPSQDTLRDKQLKAVSVGVIKQRKNHLIAQEAFEILRRDGWTIDYEVIGKVLDQELFEKIMSYPHTSYVQHCPKEELIHHYRENNLFVLPSRAETFGLVYAEAMSQGLPVIYTKGQGFDGQFPDGTVGYAVDDKDPAQIAERIAAAMKRHAELSQNCLQGADNFRWADICKTYREIYQEII